MIRHVVLLRFRADVDGAAQEALFERLSALRGRIEGMVGFCHGDNISPEGFGRGYQSGFIVEFDSIAARDAYLADPVHAALGAELVGMLEGGTEGLLVFDIAC